MSFRIFRDTGLSALLNAILRVKGTSEANASDVSGLKGDLLGLSQNVTKELQNIVQALNGKQEQVRSFDVTLAASGWELEESERGQDAGQATSAGLPFRYYYDVETQVGVNDKADVDIETGSLHTAGACGFCKSVETLDGKIRVRAQKQPEGEIRVQCTITEGVKQ